MDFLTASQPQYRYYMPINTACVTIPYCPPHKQTRLWKIKLNWYVYAAIYYTSIFHS